MESHFKRVEVALANLVDSIAKYNPNPTLAHDLLTADAELSKGLEQLTTHQANYARILSLRATSTTLDTQIRESLNTLTSIRKELIATPLTNSTLSTQSVLYTDLLAYARRISKFTLPPSYRDPRLDIDVRDDKTKASKDTLSSLQINGSSKSQPNMSEDTTVPMSAEKVELTQSTVEINNNIWADYLNPRNDIPWTPWPSEETIRRGALASIQILLNQGIDPATFDPEKSAELEAERKRIVEEEDKLREDERLRLDEEQRMQRERRMGANHTTRREEQPKVFQLETFDDEDDD
ncbi:hypothetical protein K3495_g2149 [Podosphaera aphanis]|nr:hypothetical protein K3495_g2149 [Podosphaera aphanis]